MHSVRVAGYPAAKQLCQLAGSAGRFGAAIPANLDNLPERTREVINPASPFASGAPGAVAAA